MKKVMLDELIKSIQQGGKLLKKIKFSNEKLGKVKIVKDFLPSPESLVFNKILNKDEIKIVEDSIKK